MDTEAFLGGQLARAHMRRSRLREQIASLNETMHKLMRDLGATDSRIWELKGQLRRSDDARSRA